jgi:hypothetical protein
MTLRPQGLKSAIRTALRSLGHDLMPFPVTDWFEQKVTIGRHLPKLFSHLEINCVLDVGAHHGEFGSFLRDIGYSGNIISFEPVQENYLQLVRRCSGIQNGRLVVWPWGIGTRLRKLRSFVIRRYARFLRQMNIAQLT